MWSKTYMLIIQILIQYVIDINFNVLEFRKVG